MGGNKRCGTLSNLYENDNECGYCKGGNKEYRCIFDLRGDIYVFDADTVFRLRPGV